MVAETSIEAYIELKPSLGARQREVLEVITKLGAANNRQIAEHLGLEVHKITGRVDELRKLGKIEFAFRAKYQGRTVQFHQIKQ